VAGGLILLVVVLAVAGAAGFGMRLRQGRFRSGSSGTYAGDSARSSASDVVLTAADLGAPLGSRGTLVQFSSEVCAYCGPTRELLTEVARGRDGLAFVEIDATERFDLTRRLRVFSTPTILVLAPDGSIAGRASGRPRKSDVLAAVGTVLGEVGSEGDSEAAGE
jgi:thiol-disulfide isomerase/thioredoxin